MRYRRPYIVRSSTPGTPYKQVPVPPDCPLQLGEKVVVISNGYMLVIPEGAIVDEVLLDKAIRLPKEETDEED